jgi:hypothetical protein
LTSLPPDVLTGILPPEDGTGRGQGFFNYIIEPKTGLPTGTEIRNIAIIVFDINDPIATNQVDPHDPSQGTDPAKEALNTIDAGLPTSNVNPLPAITNTASFMVSWSGVDDLGGSGVAGYDVYVSVDAGPFSLWQDDATATSATFPGAFGHTYGFYSIAVDNVGHIEAAPAVADASTTTQLAGDFNGDGVVNAVDIDALASAANNDPDNPLYDLNGDGDVTYSVSDLGSILSDSDVLIRTILQTQYGDADLNRQVFLTDLSKLATSYRQAGPFGWADGNFNGSQEIGTTASPRVFLADLFVLATHWRFGVGMGASIGDAESEPSTGSDMVVAAVPSGAIETPPGRHDSLPRRAFNPTPREKFGGDDLLLLALDRLERTSQQMVTSTRTVSERHNDDGGTESLVDEPLALALATW